MIKDKLEYYLKQINAMKLFKIAIGSSIAIIIANGLGLQYSPSAGIITLLSVQDTKKETFLIAGRRFLSFFMAIGIAFLLFQSMGYLPITFGLFLLVFVGCSYLFRLQDGISMSSVLTTHFLIEKNMELSFIGNELAIMMIGVFIAIIFNLYIPKNIEAVKSDMRKVEEEIKEILSIFSQCMLKNCNQVPCGNAKANNFEAVNLAVKEGIGKEISPCILADKFEQLDTDLKKALTKAYENMNNTLLSDTRYYIQYFEMRRNQLTLLRQMKEQLNIITTVQKQAVPISEFIIKIAGTFHEYNNAEDLLVELSYIKESFKKEPNPLTREEFENRAVLYLLLNSIDNFLKAKRNFVANISPEEIKIYWNE
ncbi:MAG: hypothetical protein K0R21_1481 [Anaerocolumna sp.]|nr:hypothetical protein [Anaerocolumna sp.]